MPARLRLWIALALAVALVLGWANRRQPTLTVLSVGQGDCAVFQSSGFTMLVDVGPSSEYVDAGERIVAPKLRSRGIRSLDLVVLTHPDADHIGGLPALSRRFRIGRVVASSVFQFHPDLVATLREAKLEDQVVWMQRDALLTAGEVKVRLWAPRLDIGEGDNEGSLLTRIEVGEAVALLCGDAGAETEHEAIGTGYDWDVDVLTAGHHGSRGSTSIAWLAATSPRWVTVSCGRGNPYGHPAPEVLTRAETRGAKVFRTDRDGDLVFVMTPGGVDPP